MFTTLVRLIRDLPIRYKVLAGGALPLLLVMGIGGGLATHHLEGTLERHLETELHATSSLIAGMVQAAAEASIRNHLRSVAETHRAVAARLHEESVRGTLSEKEAQRRALDLLLSQRVGLTGYLYVLKPDGLVVAHPSPHWVGQNALRLPYVAQQLTLDEGYMEYEWQDSGDPRPRAKALYMVRFQPWNWVISASSFRSEFASLVRAEDFREKIMTLKLRDGEVPFLLDGQGQLLLGSRADSPEARTFFSPDFRAKVLNQKTGQLTLAQPGRGTRLRSHFLEIRELGWVAGTAYSLDVAYAPVASLRATFVGMALLSLVVAFPLALWVSGRITRPISGLAEAFNRRDGVPLGVSGGDEVGRLTEGYNDFLLDLERSQTGLREKEARFRGIFLNAAEGLVQSTPEGRILEANPAMARVFGFDSPEELMEQPSEALYQDPSIRQWLIERLKAGNPEAVEAEFRKKDGSRFWGNLRMIPVWDEQGNLLRIDSMVEDVTERRRQREELEQLVASRTRELQVAKELAERATRAKSEFLSTMSHELRTPLNAILLYADLLAEEAGEVASPGVFEDLSKIKHAGQHLLGLINNILDLAKIEAGRVELHLERVEVRLMVQEAAFTLQALAAKKGLRLEVDLQDGALAVVADALRLRQVLINLGGNAVKFTEEGEIRLALFAQDGWVCAQIQDSGVGMTEEELSHVFEAFSQTEAGRRQGGTGLGLAISVRLTELMGGTLTVASQKGVGSTFTLKLPQAL